MKLSEPASTVQILENASCQRFLLPDNSLVDRFIIPHPIPVSSDSQKATVLHQFRYTVRTHAKGPTIVWCPLSGPTLSHSMANLSAIHLWIARNSSLVTHTTFATSPFPNVASVTRGAWVIPEISLTRSGFCSMPPIRKTVQGYIVTTRQGTISKAWKDDHKPVRPRHE